LAFVLGELIAIANVPWVIAIVIICLIIAKSVTGKSIYMFVMLFVFLIGGFGLSGTEISKRDKLYCQKEEEIWVTGRVSKILQNDYGFNIFIQDVKIKEQKYNNLLLQWDTDHINLHIGNIITARGILRQFKKAPNKGNFDSRNYYMSLGIYAKVSVNKLNVSNGTRDVIRDNLYDLKKLFKNQLDKICNGKTAILKKVSEDKNTIYEAILLGDKTDIDEEIKDLYSITGIAHVLAISGVLI
jgi:competence protein ComEC